MGDPLTASAAVGMGVSVLGTAVKGAAEQQQLEARAKADRINQGLAQAQAADALQRGSYQAGLIRMRASQTVGAQRAAYGSSGIDANVGTAAQVQAATVGAGEQDVQTTQLNARRQAWGFEQEAHQYGQEADLTEQGKGEAMEGSVLGGIGQVGAGAGRLFAASRPDLEGGD